MSYTLSKMISIFRQEMEDQYEPYLYSDEEIIRYLAEAQDYFMEKTDYAADTLDFTYTAGATEVTLPHYITKIRLAYDLVEREFTVMDRQDWVNYKGGTSWRTDTGIVDTLITDLSSHTMRLYPIPEGDSGFSLDVFRVAKKDLEVVKQLEVTEKPAQRILLVGARAYAYGKHDAEVKNEDLELKYLSMFHDKVGDYHYRVKNGRRYSRPVSYGGI